MHTDSQGRAHRHACAHSVLKPLNLYAHQKRAGKEQDQAPVIFLLGSKGAAGN